MHSFESSDETWRDVFTASYAGIHVFGMESAGNAHNFRIRRSSVTLAEFAGNYHATFTLMLLPGDVIQQYGTAFDLYGVQLGDVV